MGGNYSFSFHKLYGGCYMLIEDLWKDQPVNIKISSLPINFKMQIINRHLKMNFCFPVQ